jgi:hypothetical protein
MKDTSVLRHQQRNSRQLEIGLNGNLRPYTHYPVYAKAAIRLIVPNPAEEGIIVVSRVSSTRSFAAYRGQAIAQPTHSLVAQSWAQT